MSTLAQFQAALNGGISFDGGVFNAGAELDFGPNARICDSTNVPSVAPDQRVLVNGGWTEVLDWSDSVKVMVPLRMQDNSDNPQPIEFPNGSKLKVGTTDAGRGGIGGVAQVCSLTYELKWEAGWLYVMEQDGFTIRRVLFTGTTVPTTSDDDSKGFVVGSLWELDDNTIYICIDASTGAAQWSFAPTARLGSNVPGSSASFAPLVTDASGNITEADGVTIGEYAGLVSATQISFQSLSCPSSYGTLGNATLVAGTVDVSYAAASASTKVLLTRATPGGTVGDLSYAVTVGTGITINSDSASDTSDVTFFILENP